MLELIPRHTPPLGVMLDDIGGPATDRVAASLGVSPRTLRRWLADDSTPRPVLLAVFWLTRWGATATTMAARNEAAMYAGYVECLKTEKARLEAEMGRLLALRDTGAANLPTWRYLPMAPVIELKSSEPRPSVA
jgi:hypothetical protein